MEKNVLIAVILSVLVIIGFQFLMPQPPAPPQAPPPAEQQAAPSAEQSPAPLPTASAPSAPAPAADETTFRVENDLYTAVFTSRGGTIKSWSIKPYKDKAGGDVVLLKAPGAIPSLAIGPNLNFDLAQAVFNADGNDLKLDASKPTGSLTFAYAGDGLSVRRTYTFHHDSYRVDVTDEVSGMPEYWITLGSDFGIVDRQDESLHIGTVLLTGTDLEELKAKNLRENPAVFRTDLKWIAQEDKYFFSSLVPRSAVAEARSWIVADSPVIAFRAGEGKNSFVLYAGPKEHERLKGLNLGLEHIIDFGFFSIIARPIFWLMKLSHKVLDNWGWAIVFITIVTRIPFIPLINKSQKSMKKLQEIQPKMNEIKEKFKKDPKRMQLEMTTLYKKHKVNPLGGCLPILIQIPVFFALYKVLLVAIELRGAPFLLWITDLSVKDPFYVLPIVMGVTMVIQQKMTPTSMDPKQAKIMMLMPVIFTFMFLNFASGLVLYWLVNNLLSIVQQFFVNAKMKKEAAQAT